MKKQAIISEFNPFHNGHEYLVKKGKEITKADLSITLMSGDFVQRGEASCMDKFLRAESAIMSGFDLVIEMPNFISLQSAEFFARKSIEILNNISIDYLLFGIENICADEFFYMYKTLKKQESEFESLTKKYVNENVSFTSARYMALKDILKDEKYISSNNILALEYMKSIDEINPSIKAVPIPRIRSFNRDIEINDIKYASSTAIRKNKLEKSKNLMPELSFDNFHFFNKTYGKLEPWDYLFNIFKYKLLIEENKFENIIGYEEGLDNYLRKSIKADISFTHFLDNKLTLRYSKSRIKRFMINSILENSRTYNDIDINFIKILAMNKASTLHLKDISTNVNLVINKKDEEKLDYNNLLVYRQMIKASNLYSLMIGREINLDYRRKFKVLD